MRSARRLRTSVPHLLLVLVLVASAIVAVAGVAAASTGHRKVSAHQAAKAKKAAAHKRALVRKRAAARRAAIRRQRCHAAKTRTAKAKYCAPVAKQASRRRTWRPKKPTTTTTTTTPTTTTTVPTTTTTVPTTTTSQPTTTTTTTTTTPSQPTPTTTTSSSTTSPTAAGGYNGFGGTVRPGANWRPYADSSPFNQPVGATAVHPRSAQMVSRALSWGQPGNLTAGNADTTSDFGHPVYYARSSDPQYTLHATEAWGKAPIEGMKIPVPSVARPAGGDDGHMTIVTPDGWEYDLWRAQRPSNGALNFASGGRTRVDGDGLNSEGTAARFGNLAGIIRQEELVAGHIDHALFIVLRCTSNDTSFGYGVQPHATSDAGGSFVYPASKGGSRCGSTDTDAPPMGARFQLAMSDAQIQALAVPQWKKTILTALAHYGGYVGDTGGPGFALMFESGSSFTSYGLTDPLVSLAQQSNLPTWDGAYVYNMANGVNWSQYLRVLTPPAKG